MIKSRIRPFLGGVAVPAFVGAGYVTGLLPRGNDTVVTARASLRRAFEHALDMATATRDVSMPAGTTQIINAANTSDKNEPIICRPANIPTLPIKVAQRRLLAVASILDLEKPPRQGPAASRREPA